MRVGLILLALALPLAACGNDSDMEKPDITLKFPAAEPADQAKVEADAQCKPYGLTATPKGTEKQGDAEVALFTCG